MNTEGITCGHVITIHLIMTVTVGCVIHISAIQAIDVGAQRLADVIFESEVTITLTARIDDKVAYLIEAKQAGIFEISNVPDEQMDPLLGIICPNAVYPYLRVNIADLITRTGFAPVHLADVNFENFYQQRLAALQQQAEQGTGEARSPSGIVLNA